MNEQSADVAHKRFRFLDGRYQHRWRLRGQPVVGDAPICPAIEARDYNVFAAKLGAELRFDLTRKRSRGHQVKGEPTRRCGFWRRKEELFDECEIGDHRLARARRCAQGKGVSCRESFEPLDLRRPKNAASSSKLLACEAAQPLSGRRCVGDERCRASMQTVSGKALCRREDKTQHDPCLIVRPARSDLGQHLELLEGDPRAVLLAAPQPFRCL